LDTNISPLTTDDISYPEGWYIEKKDYHFYETYHRRYGRRLSAGAYSNIIKQIENNQAVLIERPENRCSVFGVRVHRKGRGWCKVVVLYDEEYKTLISAFPYNKKKYRRILWPSYQKLDKIDS
jgi:hypothetical protein